MTEELLDFLHQSAALPVRDGEVCLITSRSGNRWIIPKGCNEIGKTSPEIALQEAWEEAGLTGLIEPSPVGSFLSVKAELQQCALVFLMRVTGQALEWPECAFRERCWLPFEQAAERVADDGLREIIRATLFADES